MGVNRVLSARRRSGKISLVAMVFLLLQVVLISFVGNAGHAVNQKLEVQHAADAAAFSASLPMARGLNTVTATNHLIGEATALAVIHEAIGGPELRLKLEKNTGENRALDTGIKATWRGAPIGRIPTPYVPPILTQIDKKLLEFVTKRTSPSPSKPLTAFATLYDSRITLKRELQLLIIAKAVANLGFLPPPPFIFATAPAAYIAHIAASSQIVLIAKEWLLLSLLEKYAKAAAPVQDAVLEKQLVPLLHEFASEVSGVDLDAQQQDSGWAMAELSRVANEMSDQHEVEIDLVGNREEERTLPVEFEPEPSMQGRQGSWPRGWGSDSQSITPSSLDALNDINDDLDDTLRDMESRERDLTRAIKDIEELLEDLEKKEDDFEDDLQQELATERRAVEKLLADTKKELETLQSKINQIRQEKSQIDQFTPPASTNSQNLSIRHIPRQMDPEQERLSQWTRASTPYVDALRAPLLGLMKEQLKKSKAAEHFEKWTNRYALVKAWQFRSGYRLKKQGPSSATWHKSTDRLGMLVMKEANTGTTLNKGREPWTTGSEAGRLQAEDLFTTLSVAHREEQPLMAEVIFPTTQGRGLNAISHAIVYNANKQRAADDQNSPEQAQLGWDTLNWESSRRVPMWGALAKTQPSEWPWNLLDGLRHSPKVKLNWQVKLVPITHTKIRLAVEEVESRRETLEFAEQFHDLYQH